ncbi:unnamed protein product [Callosobruchus maculatus]|uniref:Uncharacterized protein n=1 Tax=Callosobruchus maculatus TaxID=64391 RepID=A0A653CRI1_CALMS|nr:unnamed protein product [Callosobruchus maculatus]
MTCLASKLREQACKKPVTEIVASDALLSDAEVVLWLDLREVTCEDIKSIEMRHVAVANKEGKYQDLGKVIATKGTRNVYEVDQGDAKQNSAVMLTFCASGTITPPIIYPNKRLPQAHRNEATL